MRGTAAEEMKIGDGAVPGVVRGWSGLVVLDVLHDDIEGCLLYQLVLVVPDSLRHQFVQRGRWDVDPTIDVVSQHPAALHRRCLGRQPP